MGSLKLRTLMVLGIGASCLVGPGVANAQVSFYPPDPEANHFTTSAGGWSGSSEYTNGLCVPALTCPAVDNTHVTSGGTDGATDGHLRSELAGIASLASTTEATWQSPPFTYDGAQGSKPSLVGFFLAQQAAAGSLLAVAPNTSFSVFLDDVTAGTSLALIREGGIPTRKPWTIVGPAFVEPDLLRIGSQYRIRIVTDVVHGAEVIPDASFDYDDVALAAATGEGTLEAFPTTRCQGNLAFKIEGTTGDDALRGTQEPDAMAGKAGNDALTGFGGRDCLDGGEGADEVKGNANTDLVRGGGGRDEVKGGSGRDQLRGGTEGDQLRGGSGLDRPAGGKGADVIVGGPGRDILKGRRGKDRLKAADFKRDKVNCGPGRDRAVVDPTDKVRGSCERVKVRRSRRAA